MEPITENYIHEYDWETLELDEFRSKKFNSDFKVLKIKNCAAFEDFERNFLTNDICTVVKEASHLFLVSVEFSDNSGILNRTDWTSLQLLVVREKPLIIELQDKIQSKIFFKDDKDEILHKLETIHQISIEEIVEKIRSDQACFFELLLRAMSSNLFGEFSGTLLESKLNANGDRILDQIINGSAKNSPLCLRFLYLFKSNSKSIEEFIKSALPRALQSSTGVGCFLASFDLPFINCRLQTLSPEKRFQIYNSKDPISKKNLLLQSVELNNSEVVKYLASNFKFDLNSACFEAVKLKHWDAYFELISAGSLYPLISHENDVNPSNCRKLNEVIEERAKFHFDIASGSMEKIKQYVNKTCNSYSRTVFDTTNKSALTTALENSQFQVYAFLVSKGFSKEGDGFFSVWENQNKKNITVALRQYFVFFEDAFLVEILSKTRMHFELAEEGEDYFKIVRGMYDDLSSIAEARPIMRSIAYSESLQIVFDFNNASVKEMDPSKNYQTLGTTYHNDGYIYVAVKDHRNKYRQLIGTLIHEMSHYSMYLVYGNHCKPFRGNDKKSETDYNNIMLATKEISGEFEKRSDLKIREAFFGCPSIWEAELIVRVPQLIVQYKENGSRLKVIRNHFKDLFIFFSNNVLKDVRNYEKKAESQKLIREINQSFSLSNLIQYEKILFKNDLKVELGQEDKFKVVVTNVPRMTRVSVHNTLTEREEFSLYLLIESIENNEKLKTKIVRMFQSELKPMLVIDCCKGLTIYKKTLVDFLRLLIDYKGSVVMIVTCESLLPSELANDSSIQHYVHTWDEVEKKHQEALMEREIFFQRSSVKLGQILEIRNSEIISNLSLNDLLEGNKIEVDKQEVAKMDKQVCTFFVKRRFSIKIRNKSNEEVSDQGNDNNQNHPSHSRNLIPKLEVSLEDYENNEKSFEEMIAYGMEERVVIISDKAGTGKTSVLTEIAIVLKEENPTFWVSFIFLRDHINAFEAKSNTDVEFQEFIISTVFKLKCTFEQKLFRTLYQQGRTILLLDGFDEISPHYKEMWVKVLKSFNSQSGNQLWITTRSHLGECLGSSLGCFPCALLPLEESEQIEYLMKSWALGNENDSADRRDLAESLIGKFDVLTKTGIELVGVPIILTMLARIYKDQNEVLDFDEIESLNLYSVYTKFVKSLMKDAEDKGEIAKEERQEMLSSRTHQFLDVQEKISIKHLYDHQRLELDVDFDEDEWNDEKLSRIGIFSEKYGKSFFLHETFAEFFVAQYIFNNLNKQYKFNAQTPNSSLEETVRLITETVQKEEYQIVRFFLDIAIGQKTPKLFLNQLVIENFSKIFEKQITATESYQFLVNFASDSSGSLLNIFIDIAKCFGDGNVREKLLTCERGHEGISMNALQISSLSRSNKFIEKLFEIIEKVELHARNLCIDKLDLENRNLLHLAAINNTGGKVFFKLLSCVEKVVEKEKIKTLMQQDDSTRNSILHYFAEFNKENILKEFIACLKNHLTDEDELRKLLMIRNISGSNCLQWATRFNSQTFVEELCDVLKSSLETGEVKKFFKSSDFEGRNFFHNAARNKENEGVFTKTLSCINNILDEAEVESLLLQMDTESYTVFHYATYFNNERSLRVIFTSLKHQLTTELLKALMTSKNINGDSCLHQTACFNSQAVLEELCNILQTTLEVNEVKAFFKACGSMGRNIFHNAALNENNEGVFTKLLSCASKILNEGEVKLLLLQNDSQHYKTFHYIAESSSDKSFKENFLSLRNHLTKTEMKNLLNSKNNEGDNCLHRASRSNNKTVVRELCDILESSLEKAEIKEFYKGCGFKKRNVFHIAAMNKENRGVFTQLLSCIKKALEDKELKSLLKQSDSDQNQIFHYLANLSSEKTLKEIFPSLKTCLSDLELKNLLISKNASGDNILHRATSLNSYGVVEGLCIILESSLETNEVKEMLNAHGYMGRNIFQCAAMNKVCEGVFPKLLNCVEKILNKDEMESLLQQNDSAHYTFLHYASFFSNEKSLRIIFESSRNHLSEIQLKNLLTIKSIDGENFLHFATNFNSKKFVEELCNILKSSLGETEVKEFLKECDLKGRNAFHNAAMNDKNEGVFTKLLNCVSKILDKKEVKSLLQNSDSGQENIFHLIAQFNNEKSFKEIFSCLKEYFTEAELKVLLQNINNNGKGCLELAQSLNNILLVAELIQVLNA